MAAPIVLGITIRADGSAQVRGEIDRVRAGLDGASNAAQSANRSFAAMARETLGLGSALKGLVAGLSAVALYQSAKDFVMLADKMTMLDSRIKIATKGVGDYAAANNALTKISLATGSSLEGNIVMFSRLNKSVESAGGSYKTTLGLVTTLNEGLKISGASAEESKSVIIQLSQALSSGVLRGDEFNSVMENGSRIVDALTTATGKTKGELRELAEQGKLTSDLVVGALQAQASAIHNDFGKIPPTIGAALENISTSFSRYIQSINESAAATGSIAGMLNSLSTDLVPIIGGIVTLGKAAVTVFAGQMVVSIGQYVIAKAAAIAMEAAHAAALTTDIQRTAALTAAQIANTEAMLAGNLAMGARMATTNQLNILLAAQAAATAASAAATVTFAGSLAMLLNPINLVNVGLAGLVGWEFGTWLNSFQTVRIVATASLGAILQGIENVTYYWDRLTAVVSGNSDKLDGLKAAHLAQKAAIDDNIVSTIVYEQSGKKAAEATGQQTTASAALAVQQGASSEATKKAAIEVKNHAEAIDKEIAALNDQYRALSLSERANELFKLSALGMKGAVLEAAMAIWDSSKALEAQKKAIDAGKSAMDAENDRYKQLTLSARDYFIEKLKQQNIKPEDYAPIVKQFDVNEGIVASNKEIDASRTALEQYNKTLDDTKSKTSDLGALSSSVFDGALGGINTMVGAFKTMTSAIDDNTKALDDLGEKRKLNDKMADSKFKFDNAKKYNQEEIKLNEKRLQIELSGARQMSSAASKMFGEKTSAGKAFHNLSLALGVAEMAMEAKKVAVYVAGIIPKIASGAATMFAQSGWGGFAGVAAMAAVMAGLGYSAVSGGSSATPPPVSPDSGTVLGDSTAKSESITKTYDLLKDIHAEEYVELKGINQGVASLSSGITNVITRLFQAGGLAPYTGKTGKEYNLKPITMIDPVSKWLAGFIVGGLFGTTKKKITGSGIITGATPIADIMAGGHLAASQYTTIETTKKSWFSKKVSYQDVFSALDDNTQKALDGVFNSMGDTMFSLATALGGDLKDKVTAYIIPAMKIDLMGLSGEDAAKKLTNVISTALDTLADTVFGDIIGQYQQLGEGMLETAIRIVSEVAIVRDMFAQSFIKLGDTSGEFGTKLIALSDAMAQAAGGVKELQKQLEAYYDAYFTDEEKHIKLGNRLQAILEGTFTQADINRLGTGRGEFRKTIEYLQHMVALPFINTDVYREQLSMLLKIVPLSKEYYDGMGDQGSARKAMVAERRAQQAAEEAAVKKQQEAYAAMIVEVEGLRKTLLAAGDAAGAMANELRLSKISFTDFTDQPGHPGFNAGAFNTAYAIEQAKAGQLLANQASANALQIQNVRGVMGGYWSSDQIITPIRLAIRDAIVEASGTVGTYVVRDSVDALATTLATAQARATYQATGPGLASVYAAQNELAELDNVQTVGGKLYLGDTAIEYAKTVEKLGWNFSSGRINAEQLTGAISGLKEQLGDLSDYVQTEESIAAARTASSFNLGIKGLESIGYYFGQLTQQADALAAAASKAAEPISKATEAIGRMNSITAAFGDSARAVLRGFSGAGMIGRMELINEAEQGSRTNKALLVAQAAAIASSVLTTSDASKAAEKLATKTAFSGLAAKGIRDASLLLDGLKEFDAASFENAFLRINNALSTGKITEDQYSALFNTALDTFEGMDQQIAKYNAEVSKVTDAFDTLRKAAKDLADQLLLDAGVSTLDRAQSNDEAQRQYRATLARAFEGDVTAASELQSITQTMLNIAHDSATNEADYGRIFGSTIADLRRVEAMPNPAIAPFVPISGRGDDAVVLELKALRQELAGLREDQRAGNAVIAANTGTTVKRLDEFNVNGLPTVALV
jgi:tape measure domain-containing protein